MLTILHHFVQIPNTSLLRKGLASRESYLVLTWDAWFSTVYDVSLFVGLVCIGNLSFIFLVKSYIDAKQIVHPASSHLQLLSRNLVIHLPISTEESQRYHHSRL